jgi:membrane protein implicated in regulation of membrane protease activity
MFWIWLILAAVLIVAELFTAGFFLLWFGIAAAGAALAGLLGAGTAVQWVVFIALSAVLWAVTRPFARRMRRGGESEAVGADRYVGLKGLVLTEIDNASAAGLVRIEREEWRAESGTGDVIPKGTWIEVTAVTGARLIVRPREKAGGAGT